MFKKLSTIKTMLCGICLVTTQIVIANTPMTTCPSIDMLKSFPSVGHITPITFDAQAHAMIFSMDKNKFFSKYDPMFPDYGRMGFTLSGITLHEGSTEKQVIASTLDKMQVDSEAPIRYEPHPKLLLLVCTYSSPSGDLKAMVSQEITTEEQFN